MRGGQNQTQLCMNECGYVGLGGVAYWSDRKHPKESFGVSMETEPGQYFSSSLSRKNSSLTCVAAAHLSHKSSGCSCRGGGGACRGV